MNVSFIGLGIMGLPMAKHLHKDGFLKKVYNRTKEKAAYFQEQGIQVADTPQEAAEGADLIITIVSDSSDVEEVILGEQGVIHSVKPGVIVVDMSSINPEVSKSIGARLEEKGASLLDAPVSGGEKGAVEAKLAIMVGGDEEILETARNVLEVMGSVVHVGPLGAGGYAKLANQIIVGLNIQAMSEAFYLAKRAQLDFDNLYEAIKNGLAGSNVLNQKIMNLKEETFNPGFKIELHLKDINNALHAAESLGIDLPFTKDVRTVMEEATKDNMGQLDHSGLYSYLQKKNQTN
jgi:2-hydroxy-3-oxopropionate reductase